MTDPRKNLPSASSFARYAACPGAFALERELRGQGELNPESSPEAESGTRIHAALAGDAAQLAQLKDDEIEIFAACRQLSLDTIAEVLGGVDPHSIRRHERAWCHDPEDLRPLFSGEFDLIARKANRVLVIDYKTGWAELTPAARNWQLRALVALAGVDYAPQLPPEITAALIAPRLQPKVDLVHYTPSDVDLALRDCRELARRIVEPGLPRIPGPQCRYCPARVDCPEAREFVEQMALTTTHHWDLVSGDELGAFLDRCATVTRIIESAKARAKQRLIEDPNSVRGWRLEPGAIRQTITDVGGVWQRAEMEGIKRETFISVCSLHKTNLERAIRSDLGLKGKALKAAVHALIEGLVEEKQNAPSLERITE